MSGGIETMVGIGWHTFLASTEQRIDVMTMNKENWQLVTNEPVEFEK